MRNKNTNQFIKPVVDNTGYLRLNLWNNGKNKTCHVHRLVAEAFIPNPEGKRTVNHIDCNKANPDVTNLEWATDSENMKHAFANGLCEKTREAAYKQQQILAQAPRTQKQRDQARENITLVNKRPKTEKQLESARRAINSEFCRARANEKHFERHPPIRVIETGKVYRSQRELAEELGVGESAVCACLHGRREQAGGYHFEYAEKIREPFLRDYQLEAVNNLRNGSILCGSVGSGKSRTGLFYYFKENGGWIDEYGYIPMKKPQDLIIITTAKKRDSLEWDGELTHFLLSRHPEHNKLSGNKIVVDSWNNIGKYADVEGAFFLLDEQRIVGTGAWVKAFLKIAKKNNWILLSATPGDNYSDYLPVFIANGFFKNKTEFNREHVVFARYTKFPKIERYIGTTRLDRLRDRVLVQMNYKHEINAHHEDAYCSYDISMYKDVMRNRWNPFKDEPIADAAGLCYTLRRVVNSDPSRQVRLLEILEDYPRAIIFYNFTYELEILRNLAYGEGVEVAEYNGEKHQPVPSGDKWVYLCQYNSCSEGWECIRTNCIIFFSQNYSYKMMTQAAGRIDRLNSPYTDLYYYHLRSRSGIDLAIAKALKEKKKFNERKFTRWD